jgi:hypothetical protein
VNNEKINMKKIKKNKLIKFIAGIFSAIYLFISGCSSTAEPEYEAKKFGIYLLEDQSITWESIQGKDLNSLNLKEWITSSMIDFYDYSTHVIYLNVDYNNLLNFTHNSNTPFVVVANGKRCYTGCFGPPKDTTQPCVTFTPMALCTDLVMLEFNPPQRKDIRYNDDVKAALTSLGKIKLGLNCLLSGIMRHGYFSPDSYNKPIFFGATLWVTNNEKDYIYTKGYSWAIIKAGNKTYETKLVFYNETSCYYMLPFIPPSDTLYHKFKFVFDPELKYGWEYFKAILSTDVDSRYADASTTHYFPPEMPSGTYYCYVEYYGGMMGGNAKMRYTPKGRMWMGYMRSNTIQLEYNSADTTYAALPGLNGNVTLP